MVKIMQHNENRREFLSTGIASMLLLTLPKVDLFSNNLSAAKKHPYLLFNGSDLDRIKKNTNTPVLKDYWNSLLQVNIEDDLKFYNKEIDFSKHSPDIGKTSAILLRSSLITMITNDKKYLDLALISIDKLLAFKEWDMFTEGGTNIIGFNIAPMATTALCCAYDWLYAEISEAKRKEILDAIEKRGVEACYLSIYGMQNPDKVKGWNILSSTNYPTKVDYSNWPRILNETNIKITALTGLVVGYSMLHAEGITNKKYQDMIKWGMDTSKEVFNTDGSFDEGIPYWSYTMYFYIMAVETAKRHLGMDYRNLIDFRKNAEFVARMIAPTKFNESSHMNFNDGGFASGYSPCFWIASKYKNGTAQFMAEKFGNSRDIFSIINYDPKIRPVKPGKKLLESKLENGWVVSKTGFTDEDVVFAMRSGGPANHEHADRNSIILTAYGERLLNDPHEAGYSSKDKKWNLRLTGAHSAVLIDGKGHQYHDGKEGTNKSKAEAKVISYHYSDSFMALSSDATQPYNLVNSDIKKVVRVVIFVKPDIFIIVDRMGKETAPSILSARFQIFNRDNNGKANITDSKKSFSIIRPNASLYGTCFSNGAVGITESALDVPEDMGKHPFIEVSLESAKKSELVTFFNIIKSGKPAQKEPAFEKKGNKYLFLLNNDGGIKNISFELQNDIPENILITK